MGCLTLIAMLAQDGHMDLLTYISEYKLSCLHACYYQGISVFPVQEIWLLKENPYCMLLLLPDT